jgi:hypothetical protein
MTLSIYTDLFKTRAAGFRGYRGAYDRLGWQGPNAKQNEVLAEALDAVQTVVDALTDGEGGRYRVSFSDANHQAGVTSFTHKTVVVTPKPFFDNKLKLAQAVEVVTGLSTHEIGHILYTKDQAQRLMTEHYKVLGTYNQTLQQVANVAEDLRLEFRMKRDYPGIAGSFRVLGEWIARTYSGAGVLPPKRFTFETMSLTERINFMITATRYAYAFKWRADRETRRERSFWHGWSRRAEAVVTDADLIAVIDEGVEHLGTYEPQVDEPEPSEESQDEPEPQPGEGDGRGARSEAQERPESDDEPEEESEGSEPESEPQGKLGDAPKGTNDKDDDDAEIDDAEESLLDKIGADDDDSDEDDDSDDDESDDDWEPKSGSKDVDDPEGDDWDDEPETDDDDEYEKGAPEPGERSREGNDTQLGVDDILDADVDDSEHEAHGQSDGGGINAHGDVDDTTGTNSKGSTPVNLDDVNVNDLLKGPDEANEKNSTERNIDRQLQHGVDNERQAEKITSRGGHGTMKVRVIE